MRHPLHQTGDAVAPSSLPFTRGTPYTPVALGVLPLPLLIFDLALYPYILLLLLLRASPLPLLTAFFFASASVRPVAASGFTSNTAAPAPGRFVRKVVQLLECLRSLCGEVRSAGFTPVTTSIIVVIITATVLIVVVVVGFAAAAGGAVVVCAPPRVGVGVGIAAAVVVAVRVAINGGEVLVRL